MKYHGDEAHPPKRSWKTKIIVILSFLIAFVLLIYSILYLVRTGGSVLLIIILALILLILIPLAIFSIDNAFQHISWTGLYEGGRP